MQVETFLKNKINRLIKWNGQDFVFTRKVKNQYHEIVDDTDFEIHIKGVFHDGGGYGGMLNLELYTREGSREYDKSKPMILCLVDDNSSQIVIDNKITIGNVDYNVVDKVDVKNLGIAYEISLEQILEMSPKI
jgi:hypothetical protein